MKIDAAVVREVGGPFTIESLVLDDPRPDEVIVRLTSVGICHTDIGFQQGFLPVPMPFVLGHEGAGVVERVGTEVTRLAIGDHVVLSFDTCGRCVTCRSGHPSYCLEFAARNISGGRPDGSPTVHDDAGSVVHAGFFAQSSFATHALVTERSAVKVDDTADLGLVGPLGCGLQTGAGTVLNRLRPAAGSSIAVFGAGGVGLAAVMAAKAAGCAVIIAVDRTPSRLELARELGATHTIDANQTESVPEAVRAIVPLGVDNALDTTAVTSVVRDAVSSLAPLGTCAVLGMGKGGTNVEVDMVELIMSGRTIMGVMEGDVQPQDFVPLLVRMHAEGRFPFDKIVKTYPFTDINQAIEDAESGRVIKPVLLF
ncbi:NAD(P)-dependent alcohol dehydrogenase [Rhodococcus jostii]|uniref:NAD(P)-dependent alcohol dehydrogenase n=1 Tax=Rhodococcus jostii TaxID=132919 RepID=UPI00365B74FD